MKYQIGDMLKVDANGGEAFCIITEVREETTFGVFWFIETNYIRNSPGYQWWSTSILDREFMRLS